MKNKLGFCHDKHLFSMFVVSYVMLFLAIGIAYFSYVDRLILISALMYSLGFLYFLNPELIIKEGLKERTSTLNFTNSLMSGVLYACLYCVICLFFFSGTQLILFALALGVGLSLSYLYFSSDQEEKESS